MKPPGWTFWLGAGAAVPFAVPSLHTATRDEPYYYDNHNDHQNNVN
jgi:hypothetical protein